MSYIVVSRLPSSSRARGDRGVRALRLESDFIADLEVARAQVEHVEATSRKYAWVAQVLDQELPKAEIP